MCKLAEKPLVQKEEIILAMLGMVDGNGHPYSWSAMFTGILCLRNPGLNSGLLNIRLDNDLGIQDEKKDIKLAIKQIYPYEKYIRKLHEADDKFKFMRLENNANLSSHTDNTQYDKYFEYGDTFKFEVKGSQVIVAYIGLYKLMENLKSL